MKMKSLIPRSEESFFEYAERMKRGVLCRIVPSMRERRRLEAMIGPVGYWEQIQKYHFNFLTGMGLKPYHTFLDIGCGPLPTGLVLIPYLQPGYYVGIDIRKESIAEAHIQLVKAGLAEKNPLLVVSGTFGRDELGDRKFDYIWASHILCHLDGEEIKVCFEQVSTCMKPDSKFYCDIIGYPNKVTPELRWFEFSFFVHSTNFLETLGRKYGWEMINLGKIEDHGYPVDWGMKTNNMLEFRSTDTVV